MTTPGDEAPRSWVRRPLATPAELATEPDAYPESPLAGGPESFFPDWRTRLTKNLARRSDGRWDPLTCGV